MNIKRIIILAYSAVAMILLINYFYYNNLYQNQINYIIKLLDRQVQIVGLEVDSTNQYFASDLTLITMDKGASSFFDKTKPVINNRIKEEIKLFFSKYKDFIIKVRLYDNNLNEFTLSKDEIKNEWIEDNFIALDQKRLVSMDSLEFENREFNYYATLLQSDGKQFGNIVVTVDYKKFFQKLFSEFNLEDYQWQWVISNSGNIIFDNKGKPIKYSKIEKIAQDISNGSYSNIIHEAVLEGKRIEVLSSYYSTQLLQRDIGLVFSAPTDFFQKYIIRNSIIIVISTLIIVQLIIALFWWYLRFQKTELAKLSDSEKMLMRLIEEMPVGVIIHNMNREILKANKVVAGFYSYPNESEMFGKIFPETTLPEDSDYFSKYLGGSFQPDHFVIIKKEIGELVLYRSSIPLTFMGEEATLEILIDITMLESARKQEAKANVAKSEFLARMSYELRTPLNGIIGMADIMNRYDLSREVRGVVSLLRRSTELLLEIINDILDFSKIESGKMILDEVPFNIRDEITYSVDLAKTHVEEKGIKIHSSIDNKVPESIIGDPFRLRQVLTNLLNFSINNTENGEITIKCRKQENKEGIIILSFEILDTGRIISKSDLKKVFGDFLGSDSLSIRPKDESGFGTIIAKQLIQLMGGEIVADSYTAPAGISGNKVSFSIKTYSNERQKKNINVSDIKHYNQIRTLIVSGSQNRDEELMVNIHKLGLASSVTTYQRSTIGQVKANLSLPTERYRVIVILDDADFDGFEVAKALWENKLSMNLVMIIISANDLKGNYMRSINYGIDHYMVKPCDLNDLKEAILSSFKNIEGSEESLASEPNKKDVQILLVEDNKMNRIIMEKMLGVLGYSFDVAQDGIEACNKATARKYDFIFMDMVMPEMDGYEATRRILEHDKSYRIIAYTADNMPDSRRKAELSGIQDFIPKPVRLEDLKKLFAKYFR
jgi:signal transduction histidine kinase/CheY-like chemotaxis protein